jgi:adenylylsulfate kinase-like enzyme
MLFKNWLDKEKPILWITGTPGAEKSYIAFKIINHLREQYPQGKLPELS